MMNTFAIDAGLKALGFSEDDYQLVDHGDGPQLVWTSKQAQPDMAAVEAAGLQIAAIKARDPLAEIDALKAAIVEKTEVTEADIETKLRSRNDPA